MFNEWIRGFDPPINLPDFQLPNTTSLLQPEHVGMGMALLAKACPEQHADCFTEVRPGNLWSISRRSLRASTVGQAEPLRQ